MEVTNNGMDNNQLLTKYEKLVQIRAALLVADSYAMPKRKVQALLLCGLVGLVANLFEIARDESERFAQSLALPYMGLAVSALLLLLAWRAIRVEGIRKERLDELLTSYSPLVPEAYRKLKDKGKSQNVFDSDDLQRWIEVETRAIEVASRQ